MYLTIVKLETIISRAFIEIKKSAFFIKCGPFFSTLMTFLLSFTPDAILILQTLITTIVLITDSFRSRDFSK